MSIRTSGKKLVIGVVAAILITAGCLVWASPRSAETQGSVLSAQAGAVSYPISPYDIMVQRRGPLPVANPVDPF